MNGIGIINYIGEGWPSLAGNSWGHQGRLGAGGDYGRLISHTTYRTPGDTIDVNIAMALCN